MQPTAPHLPQCSENVAGVYVALEVSAREWRVAYGASLNGPVRQRTLAPGDGQRWDQLMARARREYGLGPDVPVWSCYEAGRDAFWVHRWLTARGVRNTVVDSASIEVNRRARRAKTDRLDAAHLLRLLLRTALGEQGVWSPVHVPTPEVEDARQAGRALTMLKQERTRYRNRLHNLLQTQGLAVRLDAQFPTALAACALRPGLQQRLQLCYRLLITVEQEMVALEAQQHAAAQEAATPAAACVRDLVRLRGIGDRGAWVLAAEICARDLRNRRQVGALTGLTPVPYQSGSRARDQGISRAGLPAVRALAVEMAWAWVHWQPTSALTQWFDRRCATSGRRGRRSAIVAVARRLVIALWRYHREGIVPAGAVFKAHARPVSAAGRA